MLKITAYSPYLSVRFLVDLPKLWQILIYLTQTPKSSFIQITWIINCLIQLNFSLRPSLAYTDKKGTSSRRLATTCDMSSRGKRLRLRYFTIFPKMLLMTFCALEPTISTIRPSNSVLCLQIAGYKLRVPSCLHYTGK